MLSTVSLSEKRVIFLVYIFFQYHDPNLVILNKELAKDLQLDFSKIDNNYEVDLIKKIADWNKVIESATILSL